MTADQDGSGKGWQKDADKLCRKGKREGYIVNMWLERQWAVEDDTQTVNLRAGKTAELSMVRETVLDALDFVQTMKSFNFSVLSSRKFEICERCSVRGGKRIQILQSGSRYWKVEAPGQSPGAHLWRHGGLWRKGPNLDEQWAVIEMGVKPEEGCVGDGYGGEPNWGGWDERLCSKPHSRREG